MNDAPTKASDEQARSFEDPRFRDNPQESFKIVRQTNPVAKIATGYDSGVIVTKHEDVLTVLRSPEVFSSNQAAVDIGQIRPLPPLQIDPPDHSKYRKLTDPLFSPKRVAALEGATRELVVGLIEAIADDGKANFHQAVAEPVPSIVFLQLLGLPVSRLPEFIELKDGIIRPPARTMAERTEAIHATGTKIYAVLEEVVADRVAEPRDDMISGFLDSHVDGDRLTREDVIDICYLFFLAGLDTVTASLDCMIAFLATHPEHRQELLDDPALIPSAVEELLRWDTPVSRVARIATQDTELSGCPIAKGTQVSPALISANTDENFLERADEVDFHREANKHLAFGGGVHRCLGSHLARMELRVVLEEWHRRVPHYRIADGADIQYTQGLRQVENLELVW
ncbi:MAG: cytochrome P450 [bacterium]|nr:cytochrome P450 [bacterium]